MEPLDTPFVPRIKQIVEGKTKNFGFNSDGFLCYRGTYCVFDDKDLRQYILREVHSSPYTMHLKGNKMHRDLRELY